MAHFRAGYAQHVDDPWWKEQIEALSKMSLEFQTLWERHDVVQVPNMSKRIHHPTVGILEFDYMVLLSPDTPDLQVSIHVPKADGLTEEKIRELLRSGK
jgi:MmyB-like transcription regulator ligand binding domain